MEPENSEPTTQKGNQEPEKENLQGRSGFTLNHVIIVIYIVGLISAITSSALID